MKEDPYFIRAKKVDKLVSRIIQGGGFLIILTVVAILILILSVALPLFQKPWAKKKALFPAGSAVGAVAIGVDSYLQKAYLLDQKGSLFIYSIPKQKVSKVYHLAPKGAQKILFVEQQGPEAYTLLWNHGICSQLQIRFQTKFSQKGKKFFLAIPKIHHFSLPSHKGRAKMAFLREDEQERKLVLYTQKGLFYFKEEKDASTKQWYSLPLPPSLNLTTLCLDRNGEFLYGGTDKGEILRWELQGERPKKLDQIRFFADSAPLSSFAMIFGDISLVVGDQKGRIFTTFPVQKGKNPQKQLALIHVLPSLSSSIQALAPLYRNKSFIALDKGGEFALYHMTTERKLLSFHGERPFLKVAISSRGNYAMALDQERKLIFWEIHAPHPDVSLSVLFGKVWYENYNHPTYVWQSSAGNDDFEPKYSLVPLIFGTLKGTFYAMLIALPLALLGAIYTSQFLHPKYRQWVKNGVEIMAAIPSVVIGFLIALWLAPIVEAWLISLFLGFLFIPYVLVIFLIFYSALSHSSWLQKKAKSNEWVWSFPLLGIGFLLSMVLGAFVDSYFLGGNAKLWLYQHLDIQYDQRNCIIIAFGLGFAVIPIIFSIAEDALSSVPSSLSSASLALGASPWQTVWKVVLPAASPGIFAAVMIGLGRAVGETMIVLMATGNTPIMDWSIFNGMRTLSANIAVEIPEAPMGGSLYRVLFLCAVLLFMMTFIVNTLAEIVREKLRKKYNPYS